jgi:hypothetical protein
MDLELLKIAVIRQFGRPILNRPDCEELSLEIYEKTHEHISYNTLRRFYSLADQDKHTASRSTLTILARYLGFKNYPAFCAVAQDIDPVINIQELLVQLQFETHISTDTIDQIILKTSDQQLLSTLLPGLIFTAIHKNDVDFLKRFFELDNLFDHRNYLNHELYHALLLLGIEVRTRTIIRDELWKCWASNSRARIFYFEFFVDMDYLMVSHHQAIQNYLVHSKNHQDKIFAKSLLCWRSLFLNENSQTSSWIEQLMLHFFNTKIHPIPRARLLNCLLVYYYLNNEKTEFTKVLQKIHMEHEERLQDLDPFFQYWIIEGLCIVGEFNYCLEIIENIETNWSQVAQRFYNKGALTKTQIIKCRCLHEIGLIVQAKQLYQKINTRDCYAFSRIYDQIFLPSPYTSEVFKDIEKLKYEGLFHTLNQKK